MEETYAQIMKDLNEAIELLSGNSVQPSQILDTKPKRLVSLATAYGLRARVNLTMHKYAEAAADAQQAIANFSGSPYSMDAVSEPTFTSITDGAWMWGIAVNETDDGIAGGSIVNFPAMTCSFAHGYCDQGGAWRWASKKLYDAIPSSDVRKGWWLDENRKSVNLTEAQQAYLDAFATAVPSYGADQTANLMPYTNVKFNSYQGVLRQGLNASDIPLMRVEEMYLTLAEGQAMSGNVDGGRQTLENFVTTYRDPSYASHANSAEEVQEACWNQRRIELWGEGLAFFDIARLHKTIDRRGCAYPAAHVYVIEPGSNCLRQCIPTEEIAANKQLTSQSNNPVYAIPTPVRDN